MTRAERPDDFVEDPAPGEADDVVLVAEVVTLEVVESEDTEENDTVNVVVEVVLAEVDGAPDGVAEFEDEGVGERDDVEDDT